MFGDNNPILGAMLQALGGLLRSFGYDEQYLGSILGGIAKDVSDITMQTTMAISEMSKHQKETDAKLNEILDYVRGKNIDVSVAGKSELVYNDREAYIGRFPAISEPDNGGSKSS